VLGLIVVCDMIRFDWPINVLKCFVAGFRQNRSRQSGRGVGYYAQQQLPDLPAGCPRAIPLGNGRGVAGHYAGFVTD